MDKIISVATVLCLTAVWSAGFVGVRDYTRSVLSNSGTTVSPSQATELTLTLVTVSPQELYTWIRTAASLDKTGRFLHTKMCSNGIELIRTKQRVRAFPPDAKSSIYQAKISGIDRRDSCAIIEAELVMKTYEKNSRYVMEIIVRRGKHLSIPNEAILEEGDRKIVYLKTKHGHYHPREIQTGLEGEIYTQVTSGLVEGDEVVTFGSFFIDSEYKLKYNQKESMGHAHMHH